MNAEHFVLKSLLANIILNIKLITASFRANTLNKYFKLNYCENCFLSVRDEILRERRKRSIISLNIRSLFKKFITREIS